jgi:predicted LPLAT superfamily acyltransferase
MAQGVHKKYTQDWMKKVKKDAPQIAPRGTYEHLHQFAIHVFFCQKLKGFFFCELDWHPVEHVIT